MNDNELDVMLREHGAAWRNDNAHRPAIDWAEVTDSKRSPKIWIGLAAVVATAAAVVVPLAVVSGSKSTAKPTPAHRPLSLKVAEQGAPDGFFAIAPPTISGPGGAFAFVENEGTDSIQPGGHRAVASGVSANGRTGYAAFRSGPCVSTIEKIVDELPNKKNLIATNEDVATVHEQVARTAMAVSPDGKELAFVEDGATNPNGQCVSTAQRLAFLDLQSKTTVSVSVPNHLRIESLAWSADNRHVALELLPAPAATSGIDSGIYDVDSNPAALEAFHFNRLTAVSPLQEDRGGNGIDAPVTYWRGLLAVVLNGQLRRLSAPGRLGPPLISGLPTSTVSISVDPTGQHLLLVAGPLGTTALGSKGAMGWNYSDETQITTGVTYRWDNGRLSTVQDAWLEPAW